MDAAGPAVLIAPTEIPCTGCGLIVEGGTDGCQALFDAETARAYADARFAARRRMVVDTYCLQHPDRYCVSAISLAAHLTGVCVAVEHRGVEDAVNAAIQRWLSRRPQLDKPAIPDGRGTLTIADLRTTSDPAEHARLAEAWARATWDAYSPVHAVARGWVDHVDREPRD